MTLLHLALRPDWERAQATGSYDASTRGATIAQVGFLHASRDESQTAGVARRFYADLAGDPAALVLLHLDEEVIAAHGLTVRHEPAVPGGAELFPHVYGGPLPLEAVAAATPYVVPPPTDRSVVIAIATPAPAHLVRGFGDLDPRVEVRYDPTLLAPARWPGDHRGDPAQRRDTDTEERFHALLDAAEIIYGIPDESARSLARAVRANPRLRWVHGMAAGAGATVAAAGLTPDESARVAFTTSAGVHGDTLAEFALLGILMGAKDVRGLRADQQAHLWRRPRVAQRALDGETVLILGLGGIGVQVARRCRALGLRVIGVRRGSDPCPDADEVVRLEDAPALRDAAARARHLVVTLPGTPVTQGLVDREFLGLFPAGLTVVNVGRGSVIDEEALLEALDSGQVSFAALDVTATEPLPQESPLWDHPGVLLSPHTAALDARESERIAALFEENLRRYLSGEPLRNRVDVTAGY